MPKKISNYRGFTLIELITVVSIIAILAAIAIPQFAAYKKQAKWASIEMLLAEIGSMEREYMAEHGVFVSAPLNPPNIDGKWQANEAWNKLGFKPMQDLYGFQIKIEATADTFKATASEGKDGINMVASNETYEILRPY